jgi:NitT/TauT family transport system substrate-binding protein
MFVLFLVLTGCSGGDSTKSNADGTDKTVVRIGAMTDIVGVPFLLIDKLGLDEKYNVELEVEMFTNARDQNAAFQSGELDGVLSDMIAITMFQESGFDAKITGLTGGDFLLVAGKNSGITDISQLKGKSIGISENTIIDYSLDVILKNKGLSSSDIKKEIVPRMPDRYEMLNNGKLDFGLLPEPFSTLALNNGAINLGSASEIDLYPAISAFSQDALDEKLEAIQNVFKAYNEAVQYMNETDVKEYEDLVIEKIGYPEEMAGNIEMQKFRENTLPTKEDMEAAIKWASERDLCSPDLTYEQLVFDVTAN